MSTKKATNGTAATVKNANVNGKTTVDTTKATLAENSKKAQQLIKEAEAKRKQALLDKKADADKTKKDVKTTEKKGTKKDVKKVEKPLALAKYQDGIILAGGTWEHIIGIISVEAEKRASKIPVTKGYLKCHIKFRLNTNKNYLGDMVVTENGIEKASAVKKVGKNKKAA